MHFYRNTHKIHLKKLSLHWTLNTNLQIYQRERNKSAKKKIKKNTAVAAAATIQVDTLNYLPISQMYFE